jgi:hypothetical protein
LTSKIAEPITRQLSTKSWKDRLLRMIIGFLTSMLLILQSSGFEGSIVDAFTSLNGEQIIILVLGLLGVSYTGKDRPTTP